MSSSTEPWLERATTIFASLDASASLVTSSSSRSVLPIPPSSMTLRNRNKEKSPVPISSNLEVTNDTAKPVTGNTIGYDQKDEASTYSGDQISIEDGVARSSSSSSKEGDETLTRKKLPRVILRLGKPPDLSESVL